GFAENTDDLFVGKTLLHGDVLMWLMKTLLTSGCTNQRGAGHGMRCKPVLFNDLVKIKRPPDIRRQMIYLVNNERVH
ncbi:hypothetical protein AB0254_18015, partial [Klebsiella pneumoniae]